MNTEPPKIGRPTKLTPELQEQLVAAIKAGNSIAEAAQLVGVHEATIHRWRQQGEADDAEPPFREFREALTRARAHARDLLINAAFKDAIGGVEIESGTRGDGGEYTKVTPPNGRIALELLARMFPRDWRPVKAVEVSGPEGGPVQMSHDLEALAARISKVRADHENGQDADG